MKILSYLNNNSVMINGFSYDHALFTMSHTWVRSVMAGLNAAAVLVMGAFCATSLLKSGFISTVAVQAEQIMIAMSAMYVALLAYSFFNLFKAVTGDFLSDFRNERVNSWLETGHLIDPETAVVLRMMSISLTMVRSVQTDSAITVYALGAHDDYPAPFLIEAELLDFGHEAKTRMIHSKNEQRNCLNKFCAEWTAEAAKLLGLDMHRPDPILSDEDDLGYAFSEYDFPEVGRAKAPLSGHKLFASAVTVPDNTLTS